MKCMKHLYVGDRAEKTKKRILRRIHQKKLLAEAYVLMPALHPHDMIDVIHANFLFQPFYQNQENLVIVGIAEGKADAMNLVMRITDECFRRTGSAQIRTWLEEKIREEGIEEI